MLRNRLLYGDLANPQEGIALQLAVQASRHTGESRRALFRHFREAYREGGIVWVDVLREMAVRQGVLVCRADQRIGGQLSDALQ